MVLKDGTFTETFSRENFDRLETEIKHSAVGNKIAQLGLE
jgi:hypothetical protein